MGVGRIGRLALTGLAVVVGVFGCASIALGSVSRAFACSTALMLGTTNSCDGQTKVSGSTNGALLDLTNTNTGAAAGGLTVTGSSANQPALAATATSTATAVQGTSVSGIGVLGKHTRATGLKPAVEGASAATGANAAAVLGSLTSTHPGAGASGVNGVSAGTSGVSYGVLGTSSSSDPNAAGVDGTATGGTGVIGSSASGVGVAATAAGAAPALTAANSSTGPAASFDVAGGAPFLVNSSTKVANLNADLLDGEDATDLAGHGYAEANAFTVTPLNTGLTTVASTTVPAGSYVIMFTTTIAGSTSASPDNVGCYLFSPSGAEAGALFGNTYATDDQSTLSGTALVSSSSGGAITAQCVDSDASASAFYPSLVAVDLGTVSGAVAGSAPVAPRPHGPRP